MTTRRTLVASCALAACVNHAQIAREARDAPDPGADVAAPDVAAPDVAAPDAPAPEGTRTLVVSGELEAENDASAALAPDGFHTEFSLRVERGGAPVTTAVVTVTSRAGAVALTPSASEPGHYHGTQPGYHASYTLDVTSGGDFVRNAALTGPAAHALTAPRTNERVRAGVPYTVTWSPAGAPLAEIETATLALARIPDTGAYTLPAAALGVAPGTTRGDQARVYRQSTVPVGGAALGSSVRIVVRNEVAFVVDGT